MVRSHYMMIVLTLMARSHDAMELSGAIDTEVRSHRCRWCDLASCMETTPSNVSA